MGKLGRQWKKKMIRRLGVNTPDSQPREADQKNDRIKCKSGQRGKP